MKMKTMLICKILGHKFIGRITAIDEPFGQYVPLSFCVRCGLKKEEILQ